jgi:hypothetical protein
VDVIVQSHPLAQQRSFLALKDLSSDASLEHLRGENRVVRVSPAVKQLALMPHEIAMIRITHIYLQHSVTVF